MNNHYNSNLKEFARELRTETVSRAERYLWKSALSRNKLGVKFKRQRPLSNFIVDFFSQEIGLVVEIDGNSHVAKGGYDLRRQNQIEALGYTIVHFSEGEVLNDMDSVITKLDHIIYTLKEAIKIKYINYPPPQSPSKEGGTKKRSNQIATLFFVYLIFNSHFNCASHAL